MNKEINDNYWMQICDMIAQASTCRVKIGCLITRGNQIVGTGYVGSISGDYHCSDLIKGCLLVDNHGIKGSSDSGKSCIRTIHAEINAVLKTKERGTEKDGWLECYCTYMPCLTCFQALLQIGVRKIVYRNEYKDKWRDVYIENLHEKIIHNLRIVKL